VFPFNLPPFRGGGKGKGRYFHFSLFFCNLLSPNHPKHRNPTRIPTFFWKKNPREREEFSIPGWKREKTKINPLVLALMEKLGRSLIMKKLQDFAVAISA